MTYFDMNQYKEEDLKDQRHIDFYNGYREAIEQIKNYKLNIEEELESTGSRTLDTVLVELAESAVECCIDDLEANSRELLVGLLDEEASKEDQEKK